MLESAVLDKGLAEAVNMLWLVVAGALVFFMQAGFAFLESGMTRAKNTVNVIMKNYCDMCFGAVAFWLVGYGLMFGANHTGWLGTSAFALQGVPESQYGGLFFQMMFAATSATIVSGAIAERTRFSAYVIGSVFITALIYPVFGAWAWGGAHGGEGWLKQMGFIDFAGSTVVHAIGGWAALAALLVVGPRLGRFGPDGRPREIQGHNLTLVAMGAFILWLGWFGFNAGSTMSASVGLGRIALNTHLGGAAGALGAMATMALLRSKLMMTLTLNGSIAGLVSVTAGCHVMEPGFAVLTGFIGGALSVLASPLLDRLRVDDVVGAVSVHVVGGVWGTLAAGLFRSGHLFDLSQLGVQALGSLAAFVWGFGGSLLMYWLLDKFVPMRASTLDEQRGLDFSEHHELGYPEFQQEAVHRGVRHG
jgi:ammonium transporter, Amt family